jgi:uncharacterized protein YxjI
MNGTIRQIGEERQKGTLELDDASGKIVANKRSFILYLNEDVTVDTKDRDLFMAALGQQLVQLRKDMVGLLMRSEPSQGQKLTKKEIKDMQNILKKMGVGENEGT